MDPWAAERTTRSRSTASFGVSRRVRSQAAVGIAAVAGPLAGASPVGLLALDVAWSSGLAALGAYLGVRAKRGPLLAAAVLAAAGGRSALSVVAAAIAIGAAAASTRNLQRRAPFARGIAGGATVVSLLATSSRLDGRLLVPLALAATVLVVGSGYRNARSAARRRLRLGALGAAAFVLLAGAAAGVGALQHRGDLDRGSAHLRLGLAAARLGDVALAADHLAAAEDSLEEAGTGLSAWGALARVVPGAAQQVSAVTEVLADVERAAGFAAQAAALPEDERLEVVAGTVDLRAVGRLAGPLGRLAGALDDVVEEVDDQGSAPLIAPIRDQLDELRAESARAGDDARSGALAAQVLPTMLGGEGERRYLVLFTTPSEARGRFGFPGSFAEVLFDDGRMRLGEHGSTSEAFPPTEVADQDPFDLGDPGVRPYVAYGATRVLFSATIPPDFGDVGALAAELWAQSGRPPVDGVARFDPASLAALLRFTGPVTVEGRDEPLTADNAVDYLLLGQYVENPDDTAERREVLDEVAEVTFERLEVADLPGPRTLTRTFGPLVREGHLQISAAAEPEERFLRRVGLGGAFRTPDRDGLMLTTINGLGNKIDAFLSTSATYTGEVRGGRADTRLVVDLVNGAPPSGLPDYVIGSFADILGNRTAAAPARGVNRGTLLVYTRLPASGFVVDGRETPALSERTGDWWLHSIPFEIAPEGSKRIEVSLAGELDGDGYSLVLEPGGGASPTTVGVDLDVDGRDVGRTGAVRNRTVVR